MLIAKPVPEESMPISPLGITLIGALARFGFNAAWDSVKRRLLGSPFSASSQDIPMIDRWTVETAIGTAAYDEGLEITHQWWRRVRGAGHIEKDGERFEYNFYGFFVKRNVMLYFTTPAKASVDDYVAGMLRIDCTGDRGQGKSIVSGLFAGEYPDQEPAVAEFKLRRVKCDEAAPTAGRLVALGT